MILQSESEPFNLTPDEQKAMTKLDKALRACPLINRVAVRRLMLDTAKRERPFNKFSRVSEDTLIAANAMLRAWCVSRVKSTPSKGVTL